MIPKPDSLWCSTIKCVPAQKPPIVANECSRDPTIRSISSRGTFKCSVRPRPCLPITCK